jgi:hypothetical protein
VFKSGTGFHQIDFSRPEPLGRVYLGHYNRPVKIQVEIFSWLENRFLVLNMARQRTGLCYKEPRAK